MSDSLCILTGAVGYLLDNPSTCLFYSLFHVYLPVLLAAAVSYLSTMVYVAVAVASPGTPARSAFNEPAPSKSRTSNRLSSPPQTTTPGLLSGGWRWASPVASDLSDAPHLSIPCQHNITSTHASTATPVTHITYNHRRARPQPVILHYTDNM